MVPTFIYSVVICTLEIDVIEGRHLLYVSRDGLYYIRTLSANLLQQS